MSWNQIGQADPEALASTRLQLHYGAYLLGSAAHSVLPHAADDSHTNLGFDTGRPSLVTHDFPNGLALYLDLIPFELAIRRGDKLVAAKGLSGESVDQALRWISDTLVAEGIEADVTRRVYPDFPDHPLMGEGRFTAGGERERRALSAGYADANRLIEAVRLQEPRMSVVRVWPHHFDLGALISLSVDGMQSIGLGFSAGDGNFDQPYFYCSPYPAPGVETTLPDLPVGRWTRDGFTSAILTASEILSTPSPDSAAEDYLAAAVAQCRALVSTSNQGITQ